MAFGILLESCGVMELTKNEIERHIIETKLKLERSGKVNIVTACNLVHSSLLPCPYHFSPFDGNFKIYNNLALRVLLKLV